VDFLFRDGQQIPDFGGHVLQEFQVEKDPPGFHGGKDLHERHLDLTEQLFELFPAEPIEEDGTQGENSPGPAAGVIRHFFDGDAAHGQGLRPAAGQLFLGRNPAL